MLEAPTTRRVLVVQIRTDAQHEHMTEVIAKIALADATERLRALTPHTQAQLFTSDLPTIPFKGSYTMVQRLYTIEFRVDVKDESKLDVIEALGKQAACHVLGQCALLGDHVKPEVVFFSHDYFHGHRNIAVLDDDVMNGMRAVTEAGNPPVAATQSSGAEEAPAISNELLAALKQA